MSKPKLKRKSRIKIRDAQELHRRGFTLEEIADLMGASQPMVSRWVRGKASG